MIKKEKLKEKISKFIKNGFLSVFLSTVFSKVITLFGGIILVRLLSKTDYGIYAYVHNCYAMLFLLNDFGISSATLQYLTENVENEQKKRAILKYSIKCCLISSITVGSLILLSPLFYPYTMDEARTLTPLLFLVPTITMLNGLLSIVLRSNFENSKYSKLQIFTTAITYVVLIIFSFIMGLKGAILSQYVYSSIILIYSIYLTFKYIKKLKEKNIEKLDKSEKKGFMKYAFASQLNDTISGLMIIIDTFLISYMIADAEVIATYNVGAKLPYALTFLSTCITIYINPHFVKHNKEPRWLKRNFNNLIKYSTFGFLVMCILLILCSKLIFTILFGEQYFNAIPIYTILVIGLFFTSALKLPCANILGALRKIKINIITNIISVVVNFISNIFFIKIFGAIGAAITTTATNIVISIVYIIYLKRYLNKMEEENSDKMQKGL